LNFAHELFSLAVDGGEIVVSEFSPLLFNLAGRLLPLALNLVPVHFGLLKLNDSILMMYRKGGEAEYSAPCKWDNDAPYIAESRNWLPEIIAAR